jgi:hypothetical protein
MDFGINNGTGAGFNLVQNFKSCLIRTAFFLELKLPKPELKNYLTRKKKSTVKLIYVLKKTILNKSEELNLQC